MLGVAAACMVLMCIGRTANAAAPGDQPQNVKPFTRFKVTRSGILNVTLPFDVPFILWGDAPKGTTHVTLRFAATPRRTQCSQVPVVSFAAGTRVETSDWLASDYTDRGETAPSNAPENDQLVQYEILANALQPGRLYCILMQTEPGRALVPSEQILLADALVPAYERFVERRAVELGTLRDDEVEPLRQELSRTVLAADPLGGFRPRPQSEFDPDANGLAVRNTFLTGAVSVYEPYRGILQQLAIFQFLNNDPSEAVTGTALHEQFLADWRAWRSRADFAPFIAKVPAAVQPAALFVAGLSERQRANQFVGLLPDARAEVLNSISRFDPDYPDPADGVPRRGDPCPQAGDVAARCAQLGALIERLTAVQSAASSLAFGALAEAMSASIDDLQSHKVHLLQIQTLRKTVHARVVSAIGDLRGTILISVRVVATTSGSAETRRQWYISADTGVAVAPVIGEMFPYVGTDIYFRPVNKQAPPGGFLTRFAALFGFTWTSNLPKAGQREALYGEDAMLIAGAGLRLTEVLRVNGGALFFKSPDPNPLLDKTNLAYTPFFSVSADIDVGGIVGGLFGARPPAK